MFWGDVYMIKAERIWYDDMGFTEYKEVYKFNNLAELINWLMNNGLLKIFTIAVKEYNTPDIVLPDVDNVVVIMKLPDDMGGDTNEVSNNVSR